MVVYESEVQGVFVFEVRKTETSERCVNTPMHSPGLRLTLR